MITNRWLFAGGLMWITIAAQRDDLLGLLFLIVGNLYVVFSIEDAGKPKP